MERKWKIFLAYLFGWISGLVVLLIERKDQEVKYHAAQSLVVFLGIGIITTLLGILRYFVKGIGILIVLINIISLILWIYFLYGAITGKNYKLGIVKGIVEKLAK